MDDRPRGDGGADAQYVSFVEKVWDPYLRLSRLLTGDPHRAEELLQDSLVKLYQRWRRVSAHGNPHAYLRRMLVNANTSRWRRGRREHLVEVVPEVPDPAGVRHEPDEELRRALLSLPPHQRAVVVLRHYADLTEREVATALGCSIGTVKSQNARAMARLRERLSAIGTKEGTYQR
jgi:RNA polymerase sigma-70 factor (sigma-E family)